MRPDEILPALLASDPARPRVTFYDDAPGPTKGERIELSGKVLANWVNKAANLLTQEFDAGPGTRVALRLPASHWRTVYWAFAVWAVGGTVVTEGPATVGTAPVGLADEVDVLVTAEPAGSTGDVVVVTLAALARQFPGDVAGAIDEAREISSYDDQFTALERADDGDVALVGREQEWTYGELITPAPEFDRRYVTGELDPVLRESVGVLASLGSVVLMRNPDGGKLADRLVAECVTIAM